MRFPDSGGLRQSGNSPESSLGSGRRGADQMSVGSQNQDEVNEVENNEHGRASSSLPGWPRSTK